MHPYVFALWISGLVLLIYLLWSHYDARREARLEHEVQQLAALGEMLPPTLHPTIDPTRCIGSGACVSACPEHQVIGLMQGRVRLVNALGCVGHGACAAACPAQAIQLVFGTRTRGLDLPRLDRNFQTNQPGVYIVGELAGMGLIRNAVLQGIQAARHIAAGMDGTAPRRARSGAYDAVVVGAGPAGVSATLKLMEAKRKVLLLDQESFGGTIQHYPRAKVVMTGDLPLPLFGTVRRKTMSREQLLELFNQLRHHFQVPFEGRQLVRSLQPGVDGMWTVRSDDREFRAANVVLALGTRGSPRKLGVPGEGLPKVHYRLLEPREFAGRQVLVVGGGNSAVETALSLSDFGGCASVTISYRREQFARCRADNRSRMDAAIRAGSVRALMPSEVREIREHEVRLRSASGAEHVLANDAVIAQLGGTAPSEVLKSFGIELVTKFGER